MLLGGVWSTLKFSMLRHCAVFQASPAVSLSSWALMKASNSASNLWTDLRSKGRVEVLGKML